MDLIINGIALLVAGAAIVFTAFPFLFNPGGTEKKQKVGPVYWGVYSGQSTDEPEMLKQIEIRKKAGKEKVVAGGTMYALGRGTSFRM